MFSMTYLHGILISIAIGATIIWGAPSCSSNDIVEIPIDGEVNTVEERVKEKASRLNSITYSAEDAFKAASNANQVRRDNILASALKHIKTQASGRKFTTTNEFQYNRKRLTTTERISLHLDLVRLKFGVTIVSVKNHRVLKVSWGEELNTTSR